MSVFKDHDIVSNPTFSSIRYELRPCLDPQGDPVEGLIRESIEARSD